MPRKRPPTPPEKQRAPKGSLGTRLPVLDVPDELAAALVRLADDWRCTLAEARRRCYRDAALRHAAGDGR